MNTDTGNHQHLTGSVFRTWGIWAVIAGATALVLVFVQMAGPSFEARPSAASQIGEIAGEIRQSAWRAFLNLPAKAPEPANPSMWNYLAIVAPALGAIAVVLSVISKVKRESGLFPIYATSLGAAAILFQYFWWLALLVAGVTLLVAIIANIGDIFDFS